MTATLDTLLAGARLPVSPRRGTDVAAGLRRLAADAAAHVAKIAEGPDRGPMTEDELDVDGALVFACLLHLTGHPESAQFWWQLAAGASSRAAAYCLHLHHLCLGESRRARHWFHQLAHSVSLADTAPPDAAFLDGLEIFARYVRVNGSGAHPPTGRLESEVERLAARAPHCSVIVARPDDQLVARLQEFTEGR